MAQRSYELFQHDKGSLMKIVSINIEGTDKFVSANLEYPDTATLGVAFNLDRPLSLYAKKALSSRLSRVINFTCEDFFAAKNNCLCLPVKATQGEPIDSNTVDIINNVLKTIDEEEQRFLQKRKTALQAIADRTKLSFDNPIESLQQ
jgi:hypothetical protein